MPGFSVPVEQLRRTFVEFSGAPVGGQRSRASGSGSFPGCPGVFDRIRGQGPRIPCGPALGGASPWRGSNATSLLRAQQHGHVAADIDVDDTAYTLVAQIEGVLSLARNSQDPEALVVGGRGLRRYLQSMRAP
jgi:tetracycline repressor-like protein